MNKKEIHTVVRENYAEIARAGSSYCGPSQCGTGEQVGYTGQVIGVDMTPEMLDRARRNAEEGGYRNVEFRLGEIEHLPVADQSVDVIISNCVINLSPDKEQVFKEVYRTLRPGGRLMVSDIVLLRELPDTVQDSVQAYVTCVAGAATKEWYLGALRTAGFQGIKVVQETSVSLDLLANDPTTKAGMEMSAEALRGVVESIRSIQVSAVKPTEH